MAYDIVIKSIKTGKEKIIARKLAEDPEISLQRAMELTSKLPVVYKKNIKRENLKPYVDSLNALEVKFDIIESSVEPKISVDTIEPEEEDNLKSILISKDDTKHSREHSSVRKREPQVSHVSSFNSAIVKKKKGNRTAYGLSGLFFVVILAIVIFLISQGQNKRSYKISNVDFSVVSKKGSKAHKNRKKRSPKQQSADKKVSENFADSAEYYSDDLEKMIKFYLIAISINEKNFNAWTGLLDAYKRAGKDREARIVKQRIKEIFGDRVVSVKEIIKPYGKLIDISMENGFCSLKYRPSVKNVNKIKFDIFLITKALYSLKNVKIVSIFAETKRGSGVLVRVETEQNILEYSDFIQNSAITTVE